MITRLVSILPNISELFERLLFKQLPSCFWQDFFVVLIIWLCKRFDLQHCFVAETGYWKANTDICRSFGYLFTDLSKVFCCLLHELLTAKLEVYWFTNTTFRSTCIWFSFNEKQRVKINILSWAWKNIFGCSSRLLFGNSFDEGCLQLGRW